MDYQSLIAKTRRLEALFPDVHDLFEQEIQLLKNKHLLDTATSLEAAYTNLNKEGRQLNIGIVGRVKAGKSSLLNALFFDGENILPKAATPMTAALTTLSWGETFHATIEFFTPEDIKQIELNANTYRYELKRIKDRKYEEFAVRAAISQPIDEDKIASIIHKQALAEIQNTLPDLCAAFDQSERMQQSGLSHSDLQHVGIIVPESREVLSAELLNYVGASGKYMPFTKVVHIAMPLDSLKDIRVIDTPGMNDPVQSREARTVDLLKTCDVVFIVSPTGQFLNENDLELMGRITAKEGVQELVLLASQVDTQLYGSEKRPRISDALDNIKKLLAQRASTTLSSLKRSYPEIGTVFNAIIRSPEQYLMHCSGVAHGLSQRIEDPGLWDANEKTTWDNLTHDYADFFSAGNHELTRNSLATLANTDKILKRLDAVRKKKDEIIELKMQALLTRKEQTFNAFMAELQNQIEQRIALINSTDLDALAKQRKQLNLKRDVLEKKLNVTYINCLNQYYHGVTTGLNHEADKLFTQANNSIDEQTSNETTQVTRDKSGAGNWLARKLWGGGTETITRTSKVVMTAQVYAALQGVTNDFVKKLMHAYHKQTSDLDKKISAEITPLVDKTLDGECDPNMIADTVLTVLSKLEPASFSPEIEIPPELQPRGKLKGAPAEEYIDFANNFSAIFRAEVYGSIERFFEKAKKSMSIPVSDVFVSELDLKILQITNQVENSTQTIERLRRFSAQLLEKA
ncbi:dynamin family protein [Pantoea agglomerans]|uniref:dynamin family protein n=1 Tax=Enterobacter agglomerans TaxID=549 RepID=UPI001782D222|nr:dynamin family protein [Pantoea agglomerans]MBD8181809.1 dynamin family protein [Pantoea agglomerans]